MTDDKRAAVACIGWTLLFTLCLFILGYCYVLYGGLEDQATFRITMDIDRAQIEALTRATEGLDAEMGAFCQRNCADIEDCRVYETLVFHPGALGISLLSGRAPASAYETIISDQLATDVFHSYDCVGLTIKIDGIVYTITGVYTSYEPLGAITRVAERSAVIEAVDASVRSVYVWLRARKSDIFLCAEGRKALKKLNYSSDAGAFQAVDLGAKVKSGRQRICFMVLVIVWLAALAMWKRMRAVRAAFHARCRAEFTHNYAPRAIPRLVIPFFRALTPSLLALALTAAFAVYCVDSLYISAGAIPKKLLSPGAWLEIARDGWIAGNSDSCLTFYATVMLRRLGQIITAAGVVGIFAAWECHRSIVRRRI